MNLQLIPLKRRSSTGSSRQVFLVSLAFLLGISTYLIFGGRFAGLFDRSFSVFNLDYRIFGCLFILIFIQLSSFSVIGPLFIFVLDYLFALFCALSLDSIIPGNDLSLLFIAELLIAIFLLIFLLFSFSKGAYRSSVRFFKRLGNEKTMKIEAVKLAALLLSAAVISAFGLSDINTII